jgi:hypothetical protein
MGEIAGVRRFPCFHNTNKHEAAMRPARTLSSAVLVLAAVLFCPSAGQTVQITGRVLEKAAMRAVPGAIVTWKAANGNTLVRTADSLGNFTMNGTPASLTPGQIEWRGPMLRNGMLQLRTLVPGVLVKTELYDTQGRSLSRASHRLDSPGTHALPILTDAHRSFVGFLKVQAGDETYRLKLFHTGGLEAHSEAFFVDAPAALARPAAAGDTLIVSMSGLVTAKIPNPANTGAVADIVMDYPPRDSIGLNARRPYGAIVLFDGTQGPAAALAEMNAKWVDWRDWPNGCAANSAGSTKNTSPAQFRIAKDPEFPTDTSRVTMRAHWATGAISRWGCDDIEARPELYRHGDVQIHAEWIAMGVYDSTGNTENPDTLSTCAANANTANCWVNSGVYVQNRYEIQIQSVPVGAAITDCHYMGSIVNEYAPSATQGLGTGNSCNTGTNTTQSPCVGCGAGNQFKGNGRWNAYDITFRTARYNGATRTSDGYMSMWWNGVLVHYNRRVQGLATGVSNTSGEAMDSALYGIKLQRERGDVRFRNVWMKHLKIDSTNTTFGY